MTQESKHSDPQACHDFQQQLPELIGSGQPLGDHPHVKTCETCQALIRDLETIAEAARQLLLSDENEPDSSSEDGLWERIDSAIKAEEGTSTDGDRGE
ncbi:MAG TPA: hypothetical protein VG844_03905 [Terracidiphilus sp.]|jgi:hypothetical protein|nr:hypothetical protein [Terracidiphilus sp.]